MNDLQAMVTQRLTSELGKIAVATAATYGWRVGMADEASAALTTGLHRGRAVVLLRAADGRHLYAQYLGEGLPVAPDPVDDHIVVREVIDVEAKDG